LEERLLAADLRPVLAGPDETLGARIRAYRGRRGPYLAILGDREAAAGQATPRLRDQRPLPDPPGGGVGGGRGPGVRERSRELGFAEVVSAAAAGARPAAR